MGNIKIKIVCNMRDIMRNNKPYTLRSLRSLRVRLAPLVEQLPRCARQTTPRFARQRINNKSNTLRSLRSLRVRLASLVELLPRFARRDSNKTIQHSPFASLTSGTTRSARRTIASLRSATSKKLHMDFIVVGALRAPNCIIMK